MSRRGFAIATVLLGALVLGGLLMWEQSSDDSRAVAMSSPATVTQVLETPSPPVVPPDAGSFEAPVEIDHVAQSPVDVDTRERFNEQARTFFATASQLDAEDRAHVAQQLEQELTRLEQAGGMSAGETLLIRAGLVQETAPAGPERDAQLQALRQRYRSETQLRLAAAQARPDPQFESYKARESEIVNEVMAMATIPDGLSRDEYLRRRLQSAREQLTP